MLGAPRETSSLIEREKERERERERERESGSRKNSGKVSKVSGAGGRKKSSSSFSISRLTSPSPSSNSSGGSGVGSGISSNPMGGCGRLLQHHLEGIVGTSSGSPTLGLGQSSISNNRGPLPHGIGDEKLFHGVSIASLS